MRQARSLKGFRSLVWITWELHWLRFVHYLAPVVFLRYFLSVSSVKEFLEHVLGRVLNLWGLFGVDIAPLSPRKKLPPRSRWGLRRPSYFAFSTTYPRHRPRCKTISPGRLYQFSFHLVTFRLCRPGRLVSGQVSYFFGGAHSSLGCIIDVCK